LIEETGVPGEILPPVASHCMRVYPIDINRTLTIWLLVDLYEILSKRN